MILKTVTTWAAIVAGLWTYAFMSRLPTTEHVARYSCNEDYGYQLQFLSTEPLMLYIQNFISLEESDYLMQVPYV